MVVLSIVSMIFVNYFGRLLSRAFSRALVLAFFYFLFVFDFARSASGAMGLDQSPILGGSRGLRPLVFYRFVSTLYIGLMAPLSEGGSGGAAQLLTCCNCAD